MKTIPYMGQQELESCWRTIDNHTQYIKFYASLACQAGVQAHTRAALRVKHYMRKHGVLV